MKINQLVILTSLAAFGYSFQASAAISLYHDKSSFLTDTGAIAAAPLTDLGEVAGGSGASLTLGTLTYSLGPDTTKLFSGDYTPLIPGNEFAISGVENLDIQSSSGVFSLGFDFFEPTTPASTFSATLFNNSTNLGSVTFSVPIDVLSFVGIWGDSEFNRVEIRETVGSGANQLFGQFYTGTSAPLVATPVPPALVLFGSALAGLAALRKKKRSSES